MITSVAPFDRAPAARPERAAARVRRWLLGVAAACTLACTTSVQAQDWIYAVRPGDNLWKLAEQYLLPEYDWARLRAYNGIADADVVQTGTRLRFPIVWLKQQPTPAILVQFSGTVERTRADGEPSAPLAAGGKVLAGDIIRTGEDGSATIEFADQSRILLQPNTAITFDSMSVHGATGMVDTNMRLHHGRIENEVEPLTNPASRYRIVTPPAVAAVRGTAFRVGYDADTEISLGEVTEGGLGVSAEGVTQDVVTGFGVVTKRGEPPSEPIRLPPAPDVSGLPPRVPQLRVAFSWPALPGVVAYRAQIFPGAARERLVRERTVSEPVVDWTPLQAGRYHLRLRAIDALGLEGFHAEHDFDVDQSVPPPALTGPVDGSTLLSARPALRWEVPAQVGGFHLQLAGDARFERLLIDEPMLVDWRFEPARALAPGEYLWRVASVDRRGMRGEFSAPRRFSVAALPAAPALPGVVNEAAKMQVSWSQAAHAKTYRVQLARDRAFRHPLLDVELEETQLSANAPPWGTYYVRVSGVNGDGVAGPPSRIRQFTLPASVPSPKLLLLFIPILVLLPFQFRRRR